MKTKGSKSNKLSSSFILLYIEGYGSRRVVRMIVCPCRIAGKRSAEKVRVNQTTLNQHILHLATVIGQQSLCNEFVFQILSLSADYELLDSAALI